MAYIPLLQRFWWAPVILALIIALIITRGTLSEEKGVRYAAEAKLDISNASIGVLKREIDRIMLEQTQLAQSDAERVKAGKQVIAMVEAAGKVRQVAIDKLNASASVVRNDESGCQFSEAVIREWP